MTQRQTVGEYFEIISELGSGGFGETFLAEDLRCAKRPRCVVKQLKPQSADIEVIKLSKRLFEQEVSILYQIGEHPQIPSIITHFEDRDEFYFVQEYVAGNTFAQELASGKVYGARKVVEIVTELLSVLAFVHSRGVIHRDIKPANLICRASDGKTVLIDFGAVKQVRSQSATNPHQPTHATVAIGSEGYMPPEQLSGHPRYSSDIYAVGMFAVQLLTQTHPSELRQNQRTGEWIWQDKANVNNKFAEFINRMIRYDFRQRFTDAVEALNHLRNLNLVVKNENVVSISNENFQNQPDQRQTQATFFSPAAMPQNHEANFLPQTIFPQNPQSTQPLNYQPNNHQIILQPINSLPLAFSTPEYKYLKPSTADSPTSDAISFEDFKESGAFRPIIYCFIIFSILGVLTIGAKFAYQNDTQYMTQTSVVPPETSTKLKPQYTNEFMSYADIKERKAKTSADWKIVAEEWQKAEDFYAKSESQAQNEEERDIARRYKIYCNSKKYNAQVMSQ